MLNGKGISFTVFAKLFPTKLLLKNVNLVCIRCPDKLSNSKSVPVEFTFK